MDSDSYLVVDIDNVVAYTDKVMRDVIRNHSRETVELRYEDVKHFNYWECADSEGRHITRDEWNSTIHPAFSEQANILRIEPYREVRCFLCRLINAGYRIHLATSRLKQARVPTLLWLDEYRIPHDALHFVKHGTKHIVFRTCVAIIEDDLDQARKFAEQGIQSYVLAHPWNDCAATENVTRVQNWHEIVDDLTQQISYVQTGGSGAIHIGFLSSTKILSPSRNSSRL